MSKKGEEKQKEIISKVEEPKLPKVLVCRLVTNRKNYCVKELIDSSLSLTYPNHKVVHFDNSSDDFLKETLEAAGLTVVKTEHYEKDRNGSYIYNEKAETEKEKKKRKVLPIREMMVRDMNMARDLVLGQGYDYMLILEMDIVPHPDIIEKLLAEKEDSVAAFYWLDMIEMEYEGRAGWWTPVPYYMFKRTEKTGEPIQNIIFQPEPKMWFYPSGKISYAHGGFGCTLVSRRLLEKVKFRYNTENVAQLDAYFHSDSIKNGFIPKLLTGTICKHLHTDWGNVRV